MSLKRNILASYATQIYVTLVGILILPLYLKYMGAEAYGLVGFFTMLQAWFNLLDMGLTPTVARETARFRGGATDALSYRRLLRALQLIFFAIALVGGSAMFLFSGLMAGGWLQVQTLPLAQVQLALQLMAVGVALRWMSGFYRGCISGSERLVWLSGFNAFVATLRFLGVLPVLVWVGHSPAVFFTYQLLVAVIELAGLAAKAYGLFPAVPMGQKLGWSPASLFIPIKPVIKFSLTIAFTSSVWVLVTQSDKLVLSKLLPLSDYGYLTLAVLAASGVMMISAPVNNAVIPRLIKLCAMGLEYELIDLYRKTTQLVCVIAVPASVVIALMAEKVLWVWIGDLEMAQKVAPILALYASGYGVLALSALASHLQVARGDLKLHVVGSISFVVILLPALLLVAERYGAVGAGYVWFGTNILYFFIWIPVVHMKFLKGLHATWLLKDVGAIAIAVIFGGLLAKYFLVWPTSRVATFLVILAVGLILLTIAICCSYLGRIYFKNSLNKASS